MTSQHGIVDDDVTLSSDKLLLYTYINGVCVKLHLRHKRTKIHVRLSVCLSVVSVRGFILWVDEARCFNRNLRGAESGGVKISGSTNKYKKMLSVEYRENR